MGTLTSSLATIKNGQLRITAVRTTPNTTLLKNTYWDKETSRIFACDLFGKDLFTYSLIDKQTHTLTIDEIDNPAIFAPIAHTSDRYLVSSKNKVLVIQWDGHSKSVREVGTVFELASGTNIDSAYFEPFGGVYVGNYASPEVCLVPPQNGLYGYFGGDNLREYANDFISTGGAVLVPAERVYYHLDVCTKQVHAFTWDPWTGDLCK